MRNAEGMLRLLVRETVMRTLTEAPAPKKPATAAPVKSTPTAAPVKEPEVNAPKTTAEFRQAAALGEGPIGELAKRISSIRYGLDTPDQTGYRGSWDFNGITRSDGTNSRVGVGAPFALRGNMDQDFFWGCTGAQGSDYVTSVLYAGEEGAVLYGVKMKKGTATVVVTNEDTCETVYTVQPGHSLVDVHVQGREFTCPTASIIKIKISLAGTEPDAALVGLFIKREADKR